MVLLIIGTITNFNLVFPPSTINIKEDSAYTYIYLRGGEFYGTQGNPQIPAFPLSIKSCSKIRKINVISVKIDTIVINKPIYPLQPPKIISLNIPFKFIKNKALYGSKSIYPGQNFSPHSHSDVIIYPVHYIPGKNKLLISREMKVEVEYVPKVNVNKKSYGIEYAIITADSLIDAFQSFAEWKMRKGIETKIFGLDTILANSEGKDTQEKIRNFIKSLFNSGSLKWVLLGGDTDIIPSRKLFAMKSEAGYMNDEDSIPADIYYADLQGNYDFDGDGIYGEVGDSIDLYPDVYIGRAPVHNSIEAENFANKIIKYETAPDTAIIDRYLFLGMILWNDPYTDAGIGKDRIDSLYVPDRIQVEKLYQSLGNETPASVYQGINEGYNITNHDGHGWYSVIGAGTGYLGIQDIDTLKNSGKEGIMYSIGCWVGAIDYDAIAEHWINNPDGGGIAFIGNSRYGWGSPGNPGFGYSDRFDEEFYHNLFSDKENNIGIVLSNAKAHFVPFSREANVYRWHQYEINLLGDPEMPVWTEKPKHITITSKDTINAYNPFEVGFSTQNNPIENLNVCITSPSVTILYKGKTDETGIIKYTLPDSFTEDSICIVGTGKNFLPAVKWIHIKHTQEPGIIDLSNYDYGRVIPKNQDIGLNIEITTPYTLHNVKISITSPNDSIKFLYVNPVNIESIISGDSTIRGIFNLSASGIYNGEKIPVDIYLSSDEVNLDKEFLFIGGIPILKMQTQNFLTTLPKIVIAKIFNKGYFEAQGIKRWVNPFKCVRSPYKQFGNILPQDSIVDTINIISDTANFLDYSLMGNNFENKNFQILLNRDNELLYEDWESEQIWEHTGIKDLWRITSQKSHSGIFSVYCGTKTNYYENGMDARIISPKIFIQDSATLSFYLNSTFPNYGVDGLYVEIQHSSKIDTLDFIGSGGALKDFSNNWVDYAYTLRNYQDTVQLIFEFISDSTDTSEGAYIDDIMVKTPEVKCKEVPAFMPHNFNISFMRNPITSKDYIEISTVEQGNLIMEIFDVAGRLRDKIEMKNIQSGTYFYKFPFAIKKSGLYFMIAKMAGKIIRKKFIFLKGGG